MRLKLNRLIILPSNTAAQGVIVESTPWDRRSKFPERANK